MLWEWVDLILEVKWVNGLHYFMRHRGKEEVRVYYYIQKNKKEREWKENRERIEGEFLSRRVFGHQSFACSIFPTHPSIHPSLYKSVRELGMVVIFPSHPSILIHFS